MAGKKSCRVFEDTPKVSRSEARDLGLINYFTGVECKNGHLAPRRVKNATCIVCTAENSLAYQRRMYLSSPDKYRERKLDLRSRNIVTMLLNESRYRSKKSGIEFSITKDDLVLSDTCPCCNGEMRAKTVADGIHGPRHFSPSIDRINPKLGYTADNVALICWRCNSLKKDASVNELKKIIQWMESHETKPKLSLVS